MPTLLTVTGFLAIIHYVNKREWRFGTIIGVIFVIMGSLIRFKIFEVSVVMACVFVFAKSIVDYFSVCGSEKTLKKWLLILFRKKRLIIFFVTIALCFSLNIATNYIMNSNEGLSYYQEYTNIRSAVWDYVIPDYSDCKSEYDSIGIDDNDIQMIRNGYFDSNGGMKLQKLKELHTIQEKFNSKNISYLVTIKDMFVSEIGNIRGIGDKGIASLSFIIVLAVFLVTMKKKNYLIPLLLIIPIFLFYSYLWISGKVPFRAVYILWFSSVVYVCYSFSYNECKQYIKCLFKKNKYVVYILLIFATIVLSVAGCYLSNIANNHIKNISYNENQEKLQNFIDNNENSKFEISRAVYLPNKSEDILHIYKTDINKNYQDFSCTYGELPYTKNQINNFGTDNLYSYLLEENVFFIDNDADSHVDMIKEYLNKYYISDNKISFSIVKNIGNYSIYKYYVR